MSNYYVYEWYDKENGMPWYVGKGQKERMVSMRNRSIGFIEYYNSHDVDWRFVETDLSEDDAYALERETIKKYKDNGVKLVNVAWGGRGGIHLFGESNPMYGRTWYTENTPEEEITAWKNKVKHCGSDNAMYGVSPSERMSNERYSVWREKQKVAHCGVSNGRCRPIMITTDDGNEIKFPYITACAEWLKEYLQDERNLEAMRSKVKWSLKTGKPSFGFIFSYL